jgi:hypothetical protein
MSLPSSSKKDMPMSKRQEMQRFLRYYKEQTGEHELDMRRVAEFAKRMGWRMPTPPSDIDLLAKQFTEAAREETNYDDKTGKPYRVYHAVPVASGQLNLFVYVDINEATRSQMLKSCVNRREQMVSDGLQLTFDMEHWNSVNQNQEPILLPMDLTPEWRRNAPDDDDRAA